MIILKFGGSSLQTPERISHVCQLIRQGRQRGARAVVCSAFAGATDTLIHMGRLAEAKNAGYQTELNAFITRHEQAFQALAQPGRLAAATTRLKQDLTDLSDLLRGIYLLGEAGPVTMDSLMGFGERLSAQIVSAALAADYLDARTLIQTDHHHGCARVDGPATEKAIQQHFGQHPGLQIVTGFIGQSRGGRDTTLGRGGSDYTATLLGAALSCETVEIWTDVDGVMTADPHKVAEAKPIPALSYDDAMDLAQFGAKVIYPPTLAPAMTASVTIRVKNTFRPDQPGTVIRGETTRGVTGLSSIASVFLIQLTGVPHMGSFFTHLADRDMPLIATTQHGNRCTLVLDQNRVAANEVVQTIRNYLATKRCGSMTLKDHLALITVLGQGLMTAACHTLREHGIPIQNLLHHDEALVSLAVPREKETRVLSLLHQTLMPVSFEVSATAAGL